MAKKWVCQTYPDDPAHQFDQCSDDGFCTKCPTLYPPEMGILVLTKIDGEEDPSIAIESPGNNEKFVFGSAVPVHVILKAGNKNDIKKISCFVNNKHIGDATQLPFTFKYPSTEKGGFQAIARAYGRNGQVYSSEPVSFVVAAAAPPPDIPVGLSVILMDASSSMMEQAFKESPVTRMRLAATTAAQGIFELEHMANNNNAFIAAFKFDDRVEPIFLDTVANLIERFDRDVKKFAAYIYDELFKMQQGTDINQALSLAHGFVDKFMKKQLPDFPRKNYTPIVQHILKLKGKDSIAIPNVRVLIYTDGMQYDKNGSNILHDNPFTRFPIEGVNHDILIGAFFGNETDEGCQELRGLLSLCPKHNVEQFFLFDSPYKIGGFKNLFRMASGASGFCPMCLKRELNP